LTAGLAHGTTFTVDPDYSSIEFSGFGPAEGTFSQFSGTIVYNPRLAEASSVYFSVNSGSLDVPAEGREVRTEDRPFFDVTKFPEIAFQSTKVEVRGDRLWVSGDLSMLGVTREIVLPVQILGQGLHPETGAPIAAFSAEVSLKLSSFRVPAWTSAAGVIGDEIDVRLDVVGVESTEKAAEDPTLVPKS
jgi:polyisoprenoid-binding protein YceI